MNDKAWADFDREMSKLERAQAWKETRRERRTPSSPLAGRPAVMGLVEQAQERGETFAPSVRLGTPREQAEGVAADAAARARDNYSGLNEDWGWLDLTAGFLSDTGQGAADIVMSPFDDGARNRARERGDRWSRALEGMGDTVLSDATLGDFLDDWNEGEARRQEAGEAPFDLRNMDLLDTFWRGPARHAREARGEGVYRDALADFEERDAELRLEAGQPFFGSRSRAERNAADDAFETDAWTTGSGALELIPGVGLIDIPVSLGRAGARAGLRAAGQEVPEMLARPARLGETQALDATTQTGAYRGDRNAALGAVGVGAGYEALDGEFGDDPIAAALVGMGSVAALRNGLRTGEAVADGAVQARRLGESEPIDVDAFPVAGAPDAVARRADAPAPTLPARNFQAAIRDPETGQVYVGMDHLEAIDSAPDAVRARLEAIYEAPVEDAASVGFVVNGQFMGREEGLQAMRASRDQARSVRIGEQLNRDGSVTPATPIDHDAPDVRLRGDLGMDENGRFVTGLGAGALAGAGIGAAMNSEAQAQDGSGGDPLGDVIIPILGAGGGAATVAAMMRGRGRRLGDAARGVDDAAMAGAEQTPRGAPALAPDGGSGRVEPADTRGQGRQYHGARGPIEALEEGYYNDANFYGPYALYTSDAVDVAGGYQRRKAAGVTYEVRERTPVNMFDMERPLTREEAKDILGPDALGTDALEQLDGTPNLREIMDEMRDLGTNYEMSRADIQEDFAIIQDRLMERGFGGMSHTGGLRTGRAPHLVKLYFEPHTQIELIPVRPQTDAPTAGNSATPLTDMFDGSVGMFGGVHARTADRGALERAQAMVSSGATRDDIWRETGWFQGVDGKWRFEINDSGARIAPDMLERHSAASVGSSQRRPLTEGMQHDELYDAYNLDDTTLDFGRLSRGAVGEYDNSRRSIGMYAADDPDMLRSGTLHETQHRVQREEGFATGGTPESAWGVNEQASLDAIRAQKKAALGGRDPYAIQNRIAAGYRVSDEDMAALERWRELTRQEDSILANTLSPREAYRRLAGETEARNVQTRRDFTSEERRARPPWETQDVPDDQQIIRFDGGVAESRPARLGDPLDGVGDAQPPGGNLNRGGQRSANEGGTDADFLSALPTNPEQWREAMALHPWINSPSRAQAVIMASARNADGSFVYPTSDILNATGMSSENSLSVTLNKARAAGVPVPHRRSGPGGSTAAPGGDRIARVLDIMESAERNGVYLTSTQIAERAGISRASVETVLSQVRSNRGGRHLPDSARERLAALDVAREARRGFSVRKNKSGAAAAGIGVGAGGLGLAAWGDAEAQNDVEVLADGRMIAPLPENVELSAGTWQSDWERTSLANGDIAFVRRMRGPDGQTYRIVGVQQPDASIQHIGIVSGETDPSTQTFADLDPFYEGRDGVFNMGGVYIDRNAQLPSLANAVGAPQVSGSIYTQEFSDGSVYAFRMHRGGRANPEYLGEVIGTDFVQGQIGEYGPRAPFDPGTPNPLPFIPPAENDDSLLERALPATIAGLGGRYLGARLGARGAALETSTFFPAWMTDVYRSGTDDLGGSGLVGLAPVAGAHAARLGVPALREASDDLAATAGHYAAEAGRDGAGRTRLDYDLLADPEFIARQRAFSRELPMEGVRARRLEADDPMRSTPRMGDDMPLEDGRLSPYSEFMAASPTEQLLWMDRLGFDAPRGDASRAELGRLVAQRALADDVSNLPALPAPAAASEAGGPPPMRRNFRTPLEDVSPRTVAQRAGSRPARDVLNGFADQHNIPRGRNNTETAANIKEAALRDQRVRQAMRDWGMAAVLLSLGLGGMAMDEASAAPN